MRTFAVLVLVLTLSPAARAEAPCTCEQVRWWMGWCSRHQVGWVAGVEIRSADLFEALDAHGHHIPRRHLECPSCLEALDHDGFCERHHRGFVDGTAWLSPLTYELARGRRRDPADLECPVCREHTRSYGWCSECGVGHVGTIEIAERARYDRLIRARQVLIEAVEVSRRCETCAAAMVADGRCPVCKITYRNGEPVEPEE